MNILISKQFMYQETIELLKHLFDLDELNKVEMKGIVIKSLDDSDAIRNAIEECYHDIFSDVDIKINVNLNPIDYNSNTPIYSNRLQRIGFDGFFGMSHYCTSERGEVIRLCKNNGMRFDLVFIADPDEKISTLPAADLHSKTEEADNFWFVAILALGKLMRRDYLISSHLTHKLIEDGLVLQMISRDSDKNTNFHRYGYSEKLEYLNVYNTDKIPFMKGKDDTYNYISRLLFSAVKSYDKLKSSQDNFYKSKLDNYLAIWTYYLYNI